MFEKLEKLNNQYEELTARMERPEVYSDAAAFAACEREARELRPLVEAYRAWISAGEDMAAASVLPLSATVFAAAAVLRTTVTLTSFSALI